MYYKIDSGIRKKICDIIGIFSICMTFYLLWFLYFKSNKTFINTLTINTKEPLLHTTGPYFLSLGLDTSMIVNGVKLFDPKNPKLRNLVSLLAPAYLRIGGTLSDRLSFSEKGSDYENSNRCLQTNETCISTLFNFTLTGKHWTKLYEFAKETNINLIFDLNALQRNNDGSWNSENTESFIRYSDKRKFKLQWQLGNEPNAFKHVFDYAVNATQLAKDFKKLRNVLLKYPMYRNSYLVGPDTTRPDPKHKESVEYLKEFLSNVNTDVIDAVSWHQYYLNGHVATLSQFIDTSTFEFLEYQIEEVKKAIGDYFSDGNVRIWLGETSSAYGGGAPGLSDKFCASFLWLDKLGLSALRGLDTVVRQSIYGGHYAMIDTSYLPNPDWWLSILYKTFVGRGVLQFDTVSILPVRMYCHCSPNNVFSSQSSSATVFALNVQDTNATVRIQVTDTEILNNTVFEYVLEGETGLLSSTVLLNGKRLILNEDGSLPPFKPRIKNTSQDLIMPPYSIVFWVVDSLNIKSCH